MTLYSFFDSCGEYDLEMNLNALFDDLHAISVLLGYGANYGYPDFICSVVGNLLHSCCEISEEIVSCIHYAVDDDAFRLAFGSCLDDLESKEVS